MCLPTPINIAQSCPHPGRNWLKIWLDFGPIVPEFWATFSGFDQMSSIVTKLDQHWHRIDQFGHRVDQL